MDFAAYCLSDVPFLLTFTLASVLYNSYFVYLCSACSLHFQSWLVYLLMILMYVHVYVYMYNMVVNIVHCIYCFRLLERIPYQRRVDVSFSNVPVLFSVCFCVLLKP